MPNVARVRLWLSPPGLLRGLWLALLVLEVVVFTTGVGVWFQRMHEVCLDTQATCQSQMRLDTVNVQALQGLGWSLAAYAWYTLVTRSLVRLLGVGLGVLVFWRRPASRMALVASLFLIVGLEGSVYQALALAVPGWRLPTQVLAFTGSACFGLFFYLFPSGEFVPRWTSWAALAWTALFGLNTFFPGTPLAMNQWPLPLVFGVVILFMGSMGWAQLYRYRAVSGSAERLQTRWVVFATAISLVIFLVTVTTVAGRALRINPWWLLVDLGFTQVSVLVPVAIGIAVLRHRLWDIDVIIRRTLIYSMLTSLLALAYFGSIIVLGGLFRTLTGQAQSPLVTVVSTLTIAALFVPLRIRVQAFIDRRFFRRKYDAARTLAAFALSVRNETDLAQLCGRLHAIVQESMQPVNVSLWLKPGSGSRDRP